MSEKIFNKGDVIFREGDSGDFFYRIKEGKVAVIVNYGTDDEKQLTEMIPGQFLGKWQ